MSPTVIRHLLISFFLALAGLGSALAQPTLNGAACTSASVTYGSAGAVAITTVGCGSAATPVAPAITSGAPPAGNVGALYSFQYTATGTAPITWTMSPSTIAGGLTLSGAGLLSGTPTSNVGSPFAITVTASNGTAPNASVVHNVTITNSPAITSVAPPSGTPGVAYNHQFAANQAVTLWSTTTLPAWLGSINPTSGFLSGLPQVADTGTVSFTVSAATANGTATQNVTFSVSAPTAPTITSSAPPAGTVGTAYTYTFGANGSAPITWTVASGAQPAGLNLATNGVLSGTPTTAGTYTFTVKAANATLPDATSGTISLTINAAQAGGATTSIEGTVIPVPSKLASQATNPKHAGLNGAGAEINAWSVNPARCDNTTPAITASWHHNIDFADYGNYQKLDHFDMAPKEALTYEFTATALGFGVITIGTTTFAPLVPNFVTLSTKPCDFDITKLVPGAGRSYCYASAIQDNGLQYDVTNGGASLGTCKLVPGQKYYLNIRWQDATPAGANTSDSCTYSRCGGYLQIRR